MSLARLINECRATVHVTANDHKTVYEDAAQYIKNRIYRDGEEIAADVIQGMIERDTIIEVQFYPDTPIGSYCVFHWDLDKAVEECLAIIRERREGK